MRHLRHRSCGEQHSGSIVSWVTEGSFRPKNTSCLIILTTAKLPFNPSSRGPDKVILGVQQHERQGSPALLVISGTSGPPWMVVMLMPSV